MKLITAVFLLILAICNVSYSATSKERVEEKIKLIKENVNFTFRRFYIVKIVENSEVMNAWSVGTHLVFTKKLVESLDEGELLGVVAHEMSHRERYHLFTRVGVFAGGAVLSAFDVKNTQTFTERYEELREYQILQQEFQADCDAYNWLLELQEQGFEADPQDLNRATRVLLGFNITGFNSEYMKGDPTYERYRAIEHGYDKNCSF